MGVPEGNCATPLITQRSQVQILPPLPRRRPRIPGPSVILQDHRRDADFSECPSNVRHACARPSPPRPARTTESSASRGHDLSIWCGRSRPTGCELSAPHNLFRGYLV
jgi:hypothetical protein